MARPANADAAATQGRILEEATALFGANGTGNVSIRRIAAASGVSLATVHHYFGSKEQLYEACIQSMYVELAELRDELTGAVDTPAAVEPILRSCFRFAWAHRGAIRLLMRTIIDAGHMEPERRALVHLPFLAEAAEHLRRLFDHPRDRMRLTVQSMIHLVVRYALTDAEELMMLTVADDEEGALKAVEDHLVDCAFRLLNEG